MKKKKIVWLIHGLFFGLILFIFLLYSSKGVINLGDINFPVDLKYYLEKYAYAWHSAPAIGQDAWMTLSFNQFFWYFFPLLKIGLSMAQAQAISYAVLYYLPFLFCFLLFRRGLKTSLLAAFLASFFYVLNPFWIGQWYVPLPHNLVIFTLIPAICFLVSIFWSKPKKLFFFSFLTFLFLSFANANPSFTCVAFVSIFSFVFTFWFYQKRDFAFKKILGRYFFILLSFFLSGAWWLLNPIFSLKTIYYENFTGKTNVVEWLQSVSKLATLQNVVSLRFALPFTREHPLVTYLPYFFSSFVNLFCYLPFALILLTTPFLYKRDKKLTFLLYFILVIAIFLTKALNPPFGNVFLFLFQKIPYFGIFKSAPEKFGIFYLFWLTLMLGVALERLEKNLKKFFSLGLALSLLAFAYPLYTSQLVTPLEIGQFKITPFYQEPENYRELREYLNSDPEYSRVLSINGTGNYVVTTDLGNGYYYRGLDPLAYNTKKSFIEQNNPQGNIGAIIFNNYTQPSWFPLLASLDVDYILENKDNFFEPGRLSMEEIKKTQGAFNDYFSESKHWGNLWLYEIKKEKNLPKIYLGGIKEKTDFSSLPEITFTRISPVKYDVKVSGVREEFLLVLSEGFSPAWKAYVKPSSTPIPEDRHFTVNGFINGWVIGPRDANNYQEFMLVIKYVNQKYFSTGAAITAISFLILLLFQFLPKLRR